MKYIIIISLLFYYGCREEHSGAGRVRLSGTLSPELLRDAEVFYNNDLSVVGGSKNLLLNVDKEGNFDTTFLIDRPVYYNVGYNLVYLAPGDSLVANLVPYAGKSRFQGNSTGINNYLRGCVGSYGGSYIGYIGTQRLVDRDWVRRIVDSLSAARRAELDAVRGISPETREREAARITADIVNTYLRTPLYSDEIGDEPEQREAYYRSVKDRICPLVREISRDRYLDVEVVRDVLFWCRNSAALNDCLQWTPRMDALYRAAAFSGMLDGEVPDEMLARVDTFLLHCPEKDIVAELQIKRDQVDRLRKGAPATDLHFTTPEGESVMLSTYKGKPIYIDLWATWCGACLEESPAFHRLAEKYKDKDIVFLSVSTDTRTRSWLNYLEKRQRVLPEYNCVDAHGLNQGWNVQSIPRFILIDHNFNIFNAYAPRPSSGEEIEREIEELLND